MYGHRARIGYTSPPAITEVFAYEFYKMVPEDVTLAVHTLPLIERTSDEVDRGYDASLNAAHAMARAGVDVLVLGGLPINVSRGFSNAGDLIASVEADIGLPVISSFSAQSDAFRAMGAKKVAVVQPYTPDHEPRFLNYVKELGATPLRAASIGAKFIELGRVRKEQVLAAAEAALEISPGADTLYLPCPHYATAFLIADIEARFGVGVVTAQQAIVWRALRVCKIDDDIPGYGRLFSLPAPVASSPISEEEHHER